MMKVYIIYMALCSLSHAIYISRMSPMNRMSSVNRMRGPSAFRPGINLQMQAMQRPLNFNGLRLAHAASHRAPYVVYRNSPQRYTMKHYGSSGTRNLFAHGPWKTTARLPPMSAVTPEYEFVKAASAQTVVHNDGGTGAIHTIPAPNLSLSEKPIVVIEASDNPVTDQAKPTYEVTEKYPEGEYTVAKIEPPAGFSKTTSFSTPEFQELIRNGAALQLASQYSLPVRVNHHQIVPQQFQVQSLNNIPSQQDLVNTGAEGIFISPNALYQSDPLFLQKLQSQLIQRFPSVEFIPYTAEAPDQYNQVHLQPQASQQHPQIVLLENEQLNKPMTIQGSEQTQKNVVQRETHEASVVTLVPQAFSSPSTTEKQDTTTTQQPHNITVELVAAESQPVSTTIKYVMEQNTEQQNTTPIYYAQVGQSVGSVIANGFYSAINDVRAAAAMAQVEKTTEKATEKSGEDITTTTTTTLTPDLKAYFVKNDEKSENDTKTELKPLLGVPFKKATDSVNVAYTLVRSDEKQPKMTQEGAVYAGQIVEATISEDQDFNKEKATLISRRAPIRLFAISDSKNTASSTNTVSMPKVVVKAKIPAKSKLIYDDKTGEPILRIYASYVDNNSQKEAIVSKLASLKPAKDSVIKRDLAESWKASTVKSVDKSQGFDANQVTEFGLKLRERSDDYLPLFEEYED